MQPLKDCSSGTDPCFLREFLVFPSHHTLYFVRTVKIFYFHRSGKVAPCNRSYIYNFNWNLIRAARVSAAKSATFVKHRRIHGGDKVMLL